MLRNLSIRFFGVLRGLKIEKTKFLFFLLIFFLGLFVHLFFQNYY